MTLAFTLYLLIKKSKDGCHYRTLLKFISDTKKKFFCQDDYADWLLCI